MTFIFDTEVTFDVEVIATPGETAGSIESIAVHLLTSDGKMPVDIWSVLSESAQEKIKDDVFEMLRDAQKEKAR